MSVTLLKLYYAKDVYFYPIRLKQNE